MIVLMIKSEVSKTPILTIYDFWGHALPDWEGWIPPGPSVHDSFSSSITVVADSSS
jgi:hypothetical protein